MHETTQSTKAQTTTRNRWNSIPSSSHETTGHLTSTPPPLVGSLKGRILQKASENLELIVIRVDARAIVAPHGVGPVAPDLGPIGDPGVRGLRVIWRRSKMQCRPRVDRCPLLNITFWRTQCAACTIAQVPLVVMVIPAYTECAITDLSPTIVCPRPG